MFKKILMNIALGFVIRLAKKFGVNIKWDVIQANLIARLQKVLPEALDDEGAMFISNVIAVAQKVLSGEVIEKVIKLSTSGKAGEALKYLKEQIVEVVLPHAVAQTEDELDTLAMEAIFQYAIAA